MPFATAVAVASADGHRSADRVSRTQHLLGLYHCAYFEVTIERPGGDSETPTGGDFGVWPGWQESCVAVGLASKRFPLSGRMPGWDAHSYAYHSDDGKRFHSNGIGTNFGPSFGPGDTVGCGINYMPAANTHHSVGTIFFTLNGAFVGWAFEDVPLWERWYPCVGLDSPTPVCVNFGASPFRFDLRAFDALLLLGKPPRQFEPVAMPDLEASHEEAAAPARTRDVHTFRASQSCDVSPDAAAPAGAGAAGAASASAPPRRAARPPSRSMRRMRSEGRSRTPSGGGDVASASLALLQPSPILIPQRGDQAPPALALDTSGHDQAASGSAVNPHAEPLHQEPTVADKLRGVVREGYADAIRWRETMSRRNRPAELDRRRRLTEVDQSSPTDGGPTHGLHVSGDNTARGGTAAGEPTARSAGAAPAATNTPDASSRSLDRRRWSLGDVAAEAATTLRERILSASQHFAERFSSPHEMSRAPRRSRRLAARDRERRRQRRPSLGSLGSRSTSSLVEDDNIDALSRSGASGSDEEREDQWELRAWRPAAAGHGAATFWLSEGETSEDYGDTSESDEESDGSYVVGDSVPQAAGGSGGGGGASASNEGGATDDAAAATMSRPARALSRGALPHQRRQRSARRAGGEGGVVAPSSPAYRGPSLAGRPSWNCGNDSLQRLWDSLPSRRTAAMGMMGMVAMASASASGADMEMPSMDDMPLSAAPAAAMAMAMAAAAARRATGGTMPSLPQVPPALSAMLRRLEELRDAANEAEDSEGDASPIGIDIDSMSDFAASRLVEPRRASPTSGEESHDSDASPSASPSAPQRRRLSSFSSDEPLADDSVAPVPGPTP